MKRIKRVPLIKTSKTGLTRRGFLVGAGATLALPWLEGMKLGGVPSAMAQDGPELTKRFLGFYVPNGFNMSKFWPNTTGQLTETALANTSLTSLTPHLEDLLFVRGLDNHAGSAQGDGPGDHARGTSTFLTCAHPYKHASEVRLGVSVDQVLAQHYDGQTQFSSVEIGCEGGGNENSCDSGYSCAYSRNISWKDEVTPLPKEVSPRLLFQRLFGITDPNATPEALARRRNQRQSILNFVRDDATRLRQSLGSADGHRLSAYMDGISEIERRLNANMGMESCGPSMEQPRSAPSDRAEYARLMLDIVVEAMRCDITRVSTFMFGNGGSNRSHRELNIALGHHNLSHHQSDPDTLNTLAVIDAWEIGVLAALIDRMKQVDMGGHSLLDETTIYFSSEIEDGNRHFHYNLPIIMAGRAGGLQTGRYVDVRTDVTNNEPVANLFIRILQDAGANVNTFGDDGTRALDI